MLAYYLLKPTREAMILTDGSAEVRSYAVAVQALILLFVLPMYSFFSRRKVGEGLFTGVTLFFISNLILFYVLGYNEVSIGVAFFIWLGIFIIAQTAQFWALAAHIHTVEAGQRLFALIAFGGSLGALIGSQIAEKLFDIVGPFQLMLVAAGILALAILLGGDKKEWHYTRDRREQKRTDLRYLLGGIAHVFSDRYLRLIALFVVLLNCINSTGEFILADMVVKHVEANLGEGQDKGSLIGAFYADFYFWVNLLTLLFQLFVVSRLYRLIGVQGAILILPIIAFSGYALMAFLPIFAIVRIVKILENSTDYSIQSTTRHALFLPVTVEAKYDGKTAIETLFWRTGDLLQAGLVFVGTAILGFATREFALINMGLAAFWILVAFRIGRHYRELACPIEERDCLVPEMTDATSQVFAEPIEPPLKKHK
jgi:AAA family ATP:ADP antiporter